MSGSVVSKARRTEVPGGDGRTGPAPAHSAWTSTIGATLLLTAIVAVLLTAFAWPATRSTVNDVPLGIAGPPAAVAAVTARLEQAQPGAFELHRYADADGARAAIEDRDVYGAVVLGAGPPTVLTASAASPVVAQGLSQLAQGLAASARPVGAGVQVVDIVPLPRKDPRGAGFAAGSLPLVLGGILAAGLLTALLRGLLRRTVAALSYAVLGGLALTSILQYWLGTLDGSYLANASVVALGLAAIALPLLGLEALAGTAGLAIGSAVMMLLGNSLSGTTSAPVMLPGDWGAFGQLLPPGATGTLLRSVAFFDGAAAAGPLTVLSSWVAGGVALCLLGALRSRRPLPFAQVAE